MKLLDSDILTLAFHGKPGVAEKVASARDSGELRLPSIVRLEALRGRIEAVLKAGRGADGVEMSERLAATEKYIGTFQIVEFEERAAVDFDRFVGLKSLRNMGRADFLIACIALAHDAALVTRNTKDFAVVPGLKLENWAD